LLIVELADGQFYSYLKSQLALPHSTRVHKHTGAALFTVQEILDAIQEVDSLWETTLQQTIAAE